MAWLEARPGRPLIAAPRSNRLGTAWRKAVRVGAPGRWLLGVLNISAQRDRLDVLGLMASAGRKTVQHTQLLPGLALERMLTERRSDGRVAVSFRIFDAGDMVAGARVAARGVAVTTGSGGLAVLALPASTARTVRAIASRPGCVSHTIGFRCC